MMNLDTVTETSERVKIAPRMIGVNARIARFRKLNTFDKTKKSGYYYRTVTLENKTRIRGFCADNLKLIGV